MNLSDQADAFELDSEAAYYQRTIPENELSMAFDTESDGKSSKNLFLTHFEYNLFFFYSDISLSYTLQLTESSFAHDDATIRFLYLKKNIIYHIFSFGADSIVFQCRYSRSVSSNSDIVLDAPTSGPIVGNGDLTYNMQVNPGVLGGNTYITISPNHNLSGISPR